MSHRILMRLALLALCVGVAGPVAAISPGIAVPKSASADVNVGTSDFSAVGEDGHSPNGMRPADCLAAQRTFVSRNTMQPSLRRQAIADCDASVAKTNLGN